jgi:hypothetical protein
VLHAAIFGIAKYGQREMEEADEQQRKVCMQKTVYTESRAAFPGMAWQCITQHWFSARWAAPSDRLLMPLAQLAEDAAAAAARSAAAANDADAAAGATGASADARRAVRPAINTVALAQQHSAITSSGVFM